MKFSMKHTTLEGGAPTLFTDDTAPDWLTSCTTVKGSTMDNRWFWNDHVLTLEVGESVKTDFQLITRVK